MPKVKFSELSPKDQRRAFRKLRLMIARVVLEERKKKGLYPYWPDSRKNH